MRSSQDRRVSYFPLTYPRTGVLVTLTPPARGIAWSHLELLMQFSLHELQISEEFGSVPEASLRTLALC